MQKFRRQKYCSVFKPKIPKYREPNERNGKGSSITINFHSSWGEETYLNAKKCSRFRRRASLHDRMFKLILHAKATARVSTDHFCSLLSAVALPIIPNVKFNLAVIMYISIFVSKVRKAAPNPRSEFKTLLKALRSSCFRGGWRKKKLFTRKVWALCTPWSFILRPHKHWFVFCLSILSAKIVISMC